VEADFYGNVLGGLGLGYNGTGTSYASWIGAGTGYISVWYDQSGRKYNATQTVAGSQPSYNAVSKTVNFATSKFMSIPSGVVATGNNAYSMFTKLRTFTSAQYANILSLALQPLISVNLLV
jgi:hypothetical protein